MATHPPQSVPHAADGPYASREQSERARAVVGVARDPPGRERTPKARRASRKRPELCCARRDGTQSHVPSPSIEPGPQTARHVAPRTRTEMHQRVRCYDCTMARPPPPEAVPERAPTPHHYAPPPLHRCRADGLKGEHAALPRDVRPEERDELPSLRADSPVYE